MSKKAFFLLIFILVSPIWNSCQTQVEIDHLQFKEMSTSEPDSIRTLKSLYKVDDLYIITYYGDYDDLLGETNKNIMLRQCKILVLICCLFVLSCYGSSAI